MTDQNADDAWGTPPPPPPTGFGECPRHPGTVTGVRCTRCESFICPECMIPAPVGYQCPDCVERARKEFKAGAGRRVRTATGSMTKLILASLALVYLAEVAVAGGNVVEGPSQIDLYRMGAMFAPAVFESGQYWRFFTSMFLHAGILHLLMNSWALWIFGPVVEQVMGKVRFLAIYFVSGFAGGALSYAMTAANVNAFAVAVGASGAIVGLFGAFLAYNWRRRHTALAQAQLRNGIVIILLNAMLSISFRAIDWRAHLGGLIAGFLAGFFAEEAENRGMGKGVQALSLIAILAVAVVLVLWKSAAFRTAFNL